MIGRWPYMWLRLTHLPSGMSVVMDEGRSLWRMRETARKMLRGKLWAGRPPADLVRSYEIPDGAHTTPDLETGACIDRVKRASGRRHITGE
jgi:hypothetical protein